MTRKKLTLMTAITAAALGASPIAYAGVTVPATDDQAAQVAARADVSMQKAISSAEEYVSGYSVGAQLAENADSLSYMIEVVNEYGAVQLVQVDADSGNVKGVWPKAEYGPGPMTEH